MQLCLISSRKKFEVSGAILHFLVECLKTSIVILLQFSMLLLEVGNNNRHDDALEKTQENSREISLIQVMEFSSFLLGLISLSG
jgi:hypothetical protein